MDFFSLTNRDDDRPTAQHVRGQPPPAVPRPDRSRHLDIVETVHPVSMEPVSVRPQPPSCTDADGLLPRRCPGWCEHFHAPGAPTPTTVTVGPGDVLSGGYRLTRLLGRGGMGEVFDATDPSDQRVAIKIVRPMLAADPEVRRRFGSEAAALSRVSHPHVVAHRGTGVHEGVPFLVMEYVDGANLESMLRFAPRRRFGLHRAVALLDTLCSAVQSLHDAGVAHNDLKTENVFVEVGGRLVLGDFGMARPLETCCRIPAGRIEGTPAYLAPELATGLGGVPSPMSDVYSLGILAVRLLTGRLPFPGERHEVLRSQVIKTPPRPSKLRRDLPREIDDVLLEALHKDPARRPSSAVALAAALKRVAKRRRRWR